MKQQCVVGSVQLYSGHRSVHMCTISWELKLRFIKQAQNSNSVEETFEVYLDVKKETFDEKYSDDENEKK